MEEKLTDLLINSQRSISLYLSEDLWRILQADAKSGLLTSEMCIHAFQSTDHEVDYSAAIIPLMRVLENQLIHRFYLPYLDFLRTNYTPETYINENSLDSIIEAAPHMIRSKILFFNKQTKETVFNNGCNRSGIPEFTLGNYQYSVGADHGRSKCDNTAIRFYRESAFGDSADDMEITRWILRLARRLDALIPKRNGSAHAGQLQTFSDAKTVMDTLVKKDKVLFDVIAPAL